MVDSPYTLIASVIKKQEHKVRYGEEAKNPYDLSLEFALDRLLLMLEEKQQREVQIIAESRGKKEDDDLKLNFFQLVNTGTEESSGERFKKIQFRLTFRPKSMNSDRVCPVP